ncbi:DNA sulfur modification protein DndB [Paenibacillus xanthanilyticus]|uniref:DNA sulfur modification protein DndB n=1 Tax=Paenibacillus xanthanilyticus TaxID=1783531 RepID=A0ABV8JZS6_9BACL
MDGLKLSMNIQPYCERFGLTTVSMRVQDLLNYTVIDPMVQRKLSGGQLRKIAKYLQERELDHVFFGPVTLSLRDISSLMKAEAQFILLHGAKLSILDGQHRIMALGYTNDQLAKESRKHEKELSRLKVKCRQHPEDDTLREHTEQLEGLLSQLESRRLDLLESELTVQLYIGLTEEEEKQLFGDINSKVQLVSKELGHAFDGSDPINTMIQQVVDHNTLLKNAGVETRNNLTAYNKNFTCFSWLHTIASLLFTGKTQASYELARRVRHDPTIHTEILHQFFNGVLPDLPEQPGLGSYISSSRVVQEAIALFAHEHLDLGKGGRRDWTSCFRILRQIDWSHNNEELASGLGRLDNGKINLIYDKSMRKHNLILDYLRQLRLEESA